MSLFERNPRDKVTIEEVQNEICSDFANRLEDTELFILMHLAKVREMYGKMNPTMLAESKGALVDIFEGFDGTDTVVRISKLTRIDKQYVRKAIYAFYLMGLVEKIGEKVSPQKWRITTLGGMVLNKVTNLERMNRRKRPLEERFALQLKKKRKS